MKKKTLKKALTMAILVLVLGGLIAGFAVMKGINSKEDEIEEEDTSTLIFDKGKSIVTQISFESPDNSMSFTYVNDDWVYDKDNAFPLKQDGVASMAAAIGQIRATATVSKVSDDLGDYGLTKPSLTVKALFSDKSEKTFLFGDTNSFNSCRYFMISGDDKVYMVEEDIADPFSADLDYLYENESYRLQADSVTSDDVSAITLYTANGAEKKISDEAGISKLYDLVYTLDLSEYEDYYAASEEMKTNYGISPEGERVTVSYTVETDDGTKVPKEYTVYIGFKYESAEETDPESDETTAADKPSHCYFYSFEGSDVVYSAKGDTIDEIFAFLAYEPSAEETTAAE